MKVIGKFARDVVITHDSQPKNFPNQEFKEMWDGDDDYTVAPVDTNYEMLDDGTGIELRDDGGFELRDQ